MLPSIRRYARCAFHHLGAEHREDAVEEVIANAAVAFARLAALEKTDLAYPTVLARYGIAQVRDGRRVGTRRRIGEVLSFYAQQKKGFRVERLDRFDRDSGQWFEAIVEDHRTPVPEQVAFRVDFPAWLDSLSRPKRRIAEALAVGHSTSQVARRLRLSPGRVSQVRREVYHSWRRFHEGPPAAAIESPAFVKVSFSDARVSDADPHSVDRLGRRDRQLSRRT
jgi:hypothetical protein